MSVLTGFLAGPLSWSNWNLEMILWREKKRRTGRKTFGARREPQQTKPTNGTGSESMTRPL